MYESPVNVIYGEMQTQIEGDIFKAIQNVGIDVNKEELLKALQYDREQYSKGYSDGYAKAIDEFASELENHSIYADVGKMGVKMEWVSPVTRIKEVAEQLKGGAE